MPGRGRRANVGLLVALASLLAACSSGAATPALPTLRPGSFGGGSEPPLLVITPAPFASSAASASASLSASAAPSASASASAAPSLSPAPSASPPPPSVAPSDSAAPSIPTTAPPCTPEPRTDVSAAWTAVTMQIGTFTIAAPSDWVDRQTDISVTASDYFDATTIREAGANGTDGLAGDALSGPGTSITNPNVRVLALPAIASPNDVIAARLVNLYTSGGSQITDSRVDVCVGGEQGAGLQLLYQNSTKFAEILTVEHAGAAYLIEWVADATSIQSATFNELLRTWSWIADAGPPPSPSPGPSASASAGPTPTPIPTPTPTRTPTPTAAPSEGKFPNANEARILAHIPSAIRATCVRVKTIYRDETDSVHCTPKGQPQTDYSLFRTASLMNNAFAADMDTFGNPTKSSKGCLGGDYQSTYTVDGNPNGKWACVVDSDKNKVIDWTDDTNLIVSYAFSPTLTWQEMYDYWFNDAGPIT